MTLSIAICFLMITTITCKVVIPEDQLSEDGSYQLRQNSCDGLDCPAYTVLKTTKDYEVRHYGKSKWAYTNDTGIDYKQVSSKNFMRLFRYIQGQNKLKVKIPMTKPVVTYIEPSQGPFCATSYKMHFFVPYKFQDKTPMPTSKRVKLVTYDAVDLYVCSFGGYLTTENIQENGSKCFNALANDGVVLDSSRFMVAGYDGPYKFKDRHNEIMVFKTKQ